MKQLVYIFSLLFAATLTLSGCKNDVASTGSSALNKDDEIVVFLDTFHVTSSLDSCEHIITSPDSFLLGELATDYGVLRGEILTQMACPVGFQYPDNAEVDSVCLFLYYNSSLGDALSPLAIDVYEMDLQTLDYPRVYYSDLDVSEYCSLDDSTLLTTESRIVVAAEYQDSVGYSSTYIPCITFKMSDAFAQRIFQIKNFKDQDEFNKQFKGLYITTDYGCSSILHITTIGMGVYYHFPYERWNPSTMEYEQVIENDAKFFYSNSEIKQLNRFEYMNQHSLLDSLNQYVDVLNYVIAPAGVCTQIHFPMQEMTETILNKIGLDNKRNSYINMANLKVNVLYDPNKSDASKTRNDWLKPASQMLLVVDTIRDEFFKNKWLLVTTDDAVLSSLMTGVDENGDTYYYYLFDMKELLMQQIRALKHDQVLTMSLIPVSVESTTSSSGTTTITAIQQMQTASATVILSPNNPAMPLSFEVIYSGF